MRTVVLGHTSQYHAKSDQRSVARVRQVILRHLVSIAAAGLFLAAFNQPTVSNPLNRLLFSLHFLLATTPVEVK